MKMTNKRNRQQSASVINQLLQEVSPVDKAQIENKMLFAARLEELMKQNGWSKGEFAEKLGKNASEITKWLSGTHNFTMDTLSEIAFFLKLPLAELFAPKKQQVVHNVNYFIVVPQAKSGVAFMTPIEEISPNLKVTGEDILHIAKTFNTGQPV
jgi:transcriptional regulator with XRE-family HTH domain